MLPSEGIEGQLTGVALGRRFVWYPEALGDTPTLHFLDNLMDCVESIRVGMLVLRASVMVRGGKGSHGLGIIVLGPAVISIKRRAQVVGAG